MKLNIILNDGIVQMLFESLQTFFVDTFSNEIASVLDIAVKLFILAAITLLFDYVLKNVFSFSYFLFRKRIKNALLEAFSRSKVFNALAHFVSLGVVHFFINIVFTGYSTKFVDVIKTIFYLLIVYTTSILFRRCLKSINYYYEHKNDFYKITAIRAITESLSIASIIVFIIIGIQVIFNVNSKSILGSLGAMAAIILLIFRDTILGFVTGIHVSTSKNMKVGDWIAIPKYNLQGTIQDISLLTTKIINFDKTISTIPTYDLLSTEIRNNQVMSESNTRRIKRSITFNIDSFHFLSDEEILRLKKINIISDYLEDKNKIIQEEKLSMKNADVIFNGQQLTNIGVFRKYVYRYLETNPKINEQETIVVRHLQASSQGLPLEIYCFANESALKGYEEIQADIFDHLLTVAKEFDLDILQFGFKL